MNDTGSARRQRPALWIAALVGIVVAGAVIYLLLRDSGPHTVRFEVTSSGEKVSSITYGTGRRQLGKDVGAAAAAPWSRSHEVSDTSGKLWLHVLSPAGGAITCAILVDDKLAESATAQSGASCEIPFDDALD